MTIETSEDRRKGIPWLCPFFEMNNHLGEWCNLHNWTCCECMDPKSIFYEHPCHVREYLFRERFLHSKNKVKEIANENRD